MRLKGLHLTPERQEVPAERLSFYPSLVGTKAQQENQANPRGIRAGNKTGAMGLMDSLIFEFPEVYG